MGAHLEPEDYTRPPHLRVIARAIRQAIAKDRGRLIINVPPRHSKSETGSHWTPAWYLDRRPKGRVLLGSYEADFAGEWGRKVRDTLRQHQAELGPILSDSATAAARFTTQAGGGMWTGGIGSAMTGRGGDLLLIDDPHKNYADAHSAASRDRVWNWYRSTVRTRTQPGATIIVIQTRWHEDDLTGRLLKQDEEGTGEDWDVLRMPAIAEEDEVWDLGNGETWERAEGEALWPSQFPVEELEAVRRTIGAYLWAGLYQQRPAPPEGGLVKREDWRYWTELPSRFHEQLITVDCSFKSEDDSDFVVMQAWGRHAADRYLLDQLRARLTFVETTEKLLQFAHHHKGAAKILVEDKANGPAVISSLRKKLPGLLPWPRKESKAGNISKHERVVASSPAIESHNVFLPSIEVCRDPEAGISPSFDPDLFVEEWAEFPNGRNDDQVDAGTMALLEWGALAPKRKRGRMARPSGQVSVPTPTG